MAARKPRILVAEDNPIIAMDVAAIIEECGCKVLGPVSDTVGATDLLKASKADGAVLDVHLRDGAVWSIVEELEKRGIPFILASGSIQTSLPEDCPAADFLEKPFMPEDLKAALGKIGVKGCA